MAPRGEVEDDGVAQTKNAGIDSLPRSAGGMKRATEAKKEAPPEKPEAIWLRSKVILSFWAVIVFLGLPMWWQTTSIYRARLPIQEMLDWSKGTVCFLYVLA
jgi:GPI-anchor transamidase subunit S